MKFYLDHIFHVGEEKCKGAFVGNELALLEELRGGAARYGVVTEFQEIILLLQYCNFETSDGHFRSDSSLTTPGSPVSNSNRCEVFELEKILP